LVEVMEIDDDGARITVDLTEVSGQHLGITAWTKVRIGLVLHPGDPGLDRTFVHEVAHVFQNRLSDRRIGDHGLFTGFFVEGSAELLALELVDGDSIRRDSRRIAAASWERHRIDQRELMDGRALRQRYDFRIEYALGEMWVAALVDRYGHGAVARVFEALARPGAPRELGPAALWRDTLQAAGYSVEDVRARWEGMLTATAEQERDFIDALPRLGGGVVRHDKGGTVLLITLDRDPPPGARVMVSVRPSADAADESVRDLPASPRTNDPRRFEVVVPDSFGAGRTFQYLPGIRPEGSHWVYFETWRTADR
jgi:hypothetical protein